MYGDPKILTTNISIHKLIDYFSVNPDGRVTTTSKNLQLIGVGTIELVAVVHDKAVEPLSDTAVIMIQVDLVGTTPAPSIVRPPIIIKTCEGVVEIEEVN